MGKTQFEYPIEIREKVAAIMDRRLGWSGGMCMTEGAPEGGGDGDGQQQGGAEGGSLLDDEAENGGGSGDGGQSGDAGGEGGQSGAGSGADDDALVQKVVAALEGRFDSIADRRVNAILKEVRKQQGQSSEGQQGQGGDGGGQQQQASTSAADVREARLVYREYVGDKIKFLGDTEREHAMTLAVALIEPAVRSGADPEQAGREAAEKVATALKNQRRFYEEKTLAALKRRGVAIPEGGSGSSGMPPKGPSTPGHAAGYKAGEAKAAELFGNRMPEKA